MKTSAFLQDPVAVQCLDAVVALLLRSQPFQARILLSAVASCLFKSFAQTSDTDHSYPSSSDGLPAGDASDSFLLDHPFVTAASDLFAAQCLAAQQHTMPASSRPASAGCTFAQIVFQTVDDSAALERSDASDRAESRFRLCGTHAEPLPYPKSGSRALDRQLRLPCDFAGAAATQSPRPSDSGQGTSVSGRSLRSPLPLLCGALVDGTAVLSPGGADVPQTDRRAASSSHVSRITALGRGRAQDVPVLAQSAFKLYYVVPPAGQPLPLPIAPLFPLFAAQVIRCDSGFFGVGLGGFGTIPTAQVFLPLHGFPCDNAATSPAAAAEIGRRCVQMGMCSSLLSTSSSQATQAAQQSTSATDTTSAAVPEAPPFVRAGSLGPLDSPTVLFVRCDPPRNVSASPPLLQTHSTRAPTTGLVFVPPHSTLRLVAYSPPRVSACADQQWVQQSCARGDSASTSPTASPTTAPVGAAASGMDKETSRGGIPLCGCSPAPSDLLRRVDAVDEASSIALRSASAALRIPPCVGVAYCRLAACDTWGNVASSLSADEKRSTLAGPMFSWSVSGAGRSASAADDTDVEDGGAVVWPLVLQHLGSVPTSLGMPHVLLPTRNVYRSTGVLKYARNSAAIRPLLMALFGRPFRRKFTADVVTSSIETVVRAVVSALHLNGGIFPRSEEQTNTEESSIQCNGFDTSLSPSRNFGTASFGYVKQRYWGPAMYARCAALAAMSGDCESSAVLLGAVLAASRKISRDTYMNLAMADLKSLAAVHGVTLAGISDKSDLASAVAEAESVLSQAFSSWPADVARRVFLAFCRAGPARVSNAADAVVSMCNLYAGSALSTTRQRIVPVNVQIMGLFLACEAGFVRFAVEVAKQLSLMDSFGSSDDCDRCALHYAAKKASVEDIRLLLSIGCDPQQADQTGCLPLHIAASHGNAAAVYVLLEAYPDALHLRNRAGRTPLYESASVGVKSSTCLVVMLSHPQIQRAREIPCLRNVTPLGAAASMGIAGRAAVDALLGKGALVTPVVVCCAIIGGDSAIVQRLCGEAKRNGQEIASMTVEGHSLLLAGARAGLSGREYASLQPEIASLLVQKGCDIEAVESKHGMYALALAAMCGNSALISTLLSHGSNPNTITKNGLVPLVFAARAGYGESALRLLVSGAPLKHSKDVKKHPAYLASIAGAPADNLPSVLARSFKRVAPPPRRKRKPDIDINTAAGLLFGIAELV